MEIEFFDWHRLIFGELPAGILWEVVLRTVFVYIVLMVSMRLMGKRMASQLSRIEMAAMVSLAAAIGVPVLAPEQGLIPAIIIAAIVVLTQRLVSSQNRRSNKFEAMTMGDVSVLIKDGVFQKKQMDRTLISNERIKAQIRSEKLVHAGEVKRLYLEANGTFSIVIEENPKPGLNVLPDFDNDFVDLMTKKTNIKVCANCGMDLKGKDTPSTYDCSHTAFLYAVERKNNNN